MAFSPIEARPEEAAFDTISNSLGDSFRQRIHHRNVAEQVVGQRVAVL